MEKWYASLFVYLGFYVAFNNVQAISRWVVGRTEETSTYSSSGCWEPSPDLRGGGGGGGSVTTLPPYPLMPVYENTISQHRKQKKQQDTEGWVCDCCG